MSERLLDVKEAAAMLGISIKTLYRYAYERKIETVKLFGTALRFRQSSIEKLIKRSMRPALRPLADSEDCEPDTDSRARRVPRLRSCRRAAASGSLVPIAQRR